MQDCVGPTIILATTSIHCRGSDRVRNSCNFCPDNSFTSTSLALFVAVRESLLVLCYIFFSSFIRLCTHRCAYVHAWISIREGMCMFVRLSVVLPVVPSRWRVRVSREGCTGVQRKCGWGSTCALHRKREAHKIPSREVGISVFFPLSTLCHPFLSTLCSAGTSTNPFPPFWRGTTNTAEN